MDTQNHNDAFESNLQRTLPTADAPAQLGDDAKLLMQEALVAALDERRATFGKHKNRRIITLAVSSLSAAAVLLIAFETLQEKAASYRQQHEEVAAAPTTRPAPYLQPNIAYAYQQAWQPGDDIQMKMGIVLPDNSIVPGARFGGVTSVDPIAGQLPGVDYDGDGGEDDVVGRPKMSFGMGSVPVTRQSHIERSRAAGRPVGYAPALDITVRDRAKLAALGYAESGDMNREERQRFESLGYVSDASATDYYSSGIVVPATAPFIDTADEVLSTFATDVDRASYAIVRQNFLFGLRPLPASVRTEEFINYFDYDYPPPADEDFAVTVDAAPSPFRADAGLYLMRVALQGRVVDAADRKPAVLTFVIDVSGSMNSEQKLGLAKDALITLVDQLRPDDEVAIVSFAEEARTELKHTPLRDRETIVDVIDGLAIRSATNVSAGLKLGYELAEAGFVDGANNRVVLCTDGFGNVDETTADGMLNLVDGHIAAGITLTTVGFGMCTCNDKMMDKLADNGDGQSFYVDDATEAHRVFVDGLTGVLQLIARDAKVQVEFNPDLVSKYRLIGYDNRLLPHEAFKDDGVDAGEIGAGHQVTALYEIALDDAAATLDEPIATVRLRYESERDHEIHEQDASLAAVAIAPSFDQAPIEFQWAAAIGEWAEMLRLSDHVADTDPQAVADLLEALTLESPERTVAERGEAATWCEKSVAFCTQLREAVQAGEVSAAPGTDGPADVYPAGNEGD